jgi:hypothetical protein
MVVSGEILCDSLHVSVFLHHPDKLFEVGAMFVEAAFQRSIRRRSRIPKEDSYQKHDKQKDAANNDEKNPYYATKYRLFRFRRPPWSRFAGIGPVGHWFSL